jgi:hypothetical protein
MISRAEAWQLIRGNAAGIGIELAVNVGLPFLAYMLTRHALGDFNALICASAPPILWALVQFARSRKLDMLSLFVLTGIILTIIAYAGGGSVRILQLRENIASAFIGVIFLGSAAIGRPLIYELTRARLLRSASPDAEELEALADKDSRRSMAVMTVVCGIGLIASSAIACVLVFTMSIASYLLVSPVIGYGTMLGLFAWAFWYGGRHTPDEAADSDAPDSETVVNRE